MSAERDAARADYINAAREGLVAAGYTITPQLMAAIDERYWEGQRVEFNDARFLGVNAQESYKGMYQKLTEFYARAAEYSDNPSNRFMASLNVGILESLTDVASILDNELRVFSCDFFKDLCCRKVALSWEHLLAFSVHDIAGLIDSVDDN